MLTVPQAATQNQQIFTPKGNDPFQDRNESSQICKLPVKFKDCPRRLDAEDKYKETIGNQ